MQEGVDKQCQFGSGGVQVREGLSEKMITEQRSDEACPAGI